MESLTTFFTTGEVAREVGVAETRIQTVLRTTPQLRPQKVAGKRRWSSQDVEALRRVLFERGDISRP